jgi:hypothetical protein
MIWLIFKKIHKKASHCEAGFLPRCGNLQEFFLEVGSILKMSFPGDCFGQEPSQGLDNL